MKRYMSLALLLAFVALLPGVTIAQQQSAGAAVTQTGARGDAALRCDSSTTGTAANIHTLQNPGAGLSNYVTYIGNWGAVSGSVVTATPAQLTATGFTGTTTAGWMPMNTATTGTLVTGGLGGGAMVFNPPIKGNANTAQTLAPGPVISGITSILQVCYYPAP